MQSFKEATIPRPEMYCHPASFFIRREDDCRNLTRFTDLGELLDQSAATFHHEEDAVDLNPSSMFSLKSRNVSVMSSNLHYATVLNTSIGSSEMGTTGNECLDTGQYVYHNATGVGISHSQHTDTSADIDIDEKNQVHGVQGGTVMVVDSQGQSKTKQYDQKILRRLAQNREAARKSRLRKKAYVQQLEKSRLKLTQLEQELQRARQQGVFIASGHSGDHGHSIVGNGKRTQFVVLALGLKVLKHSPRTNENAGALAFDTDYARWLDEHHRLICDLRSAVNSHVNDNQLRVLVDGVMAHYNEVFRLKSVGAKADVFHMLSGMWKTPAERCFMWLGGFRSSEILKLLGSHLEPLTDQQLMGICNLQQSSQQAEDALSQGMEALQQSLVDTLSSASLGPEGSGNVSEYIGQMAIAIGKLATLENFLHQADLLRQQTLQQMHRVLTTRQVARAFLVIDDYKSRLRALSSLWLARPRD